MAEGGEVPSSSSQRHVESDYVFDYICNPCQFDKVVSEGISYCKICQEFFCNHCESVHKKSRATRGHNLVRGAALDKIKKQRPPEEFEFCNKHPGNVVAYYCPTHGDVFCHDCRTTAHRRCSHVSHVGDASRDIKQSQEASTFTEKLESINDKLEDLSAERNRQLALLTEQKEDCLKKIAEYRNEINKLLDRLEIDIKQEMDEVVTRESNEVQYHLSSIDTLRKSYEKANQNFELAKSSGSEEQMFTLLKKTALKTALEEPLTTIEQERRAVKIDFQPDDLIKEILSSLNRFGTVEVALTEYPTNTLPCYLRNKTLVKVSEKEIQEAGDKADCLISGCTFLPGGECLLCDHYNSSIKLLDPGLALQSNIKLTIRPFDVAMVTTKEAIVSLPGAKKLQYVAVPSLKLGRTLQIGRQCPGVAVHGDKIFVSCHDDPGDGEILILSQKGAVERRIGRNTDGSFVFTRPSYIAVGLNGARIYVPDHKQSSVTCLDMEGGEEYTYLQKGLRGIGKLLVDTEGRVVVVTCDSQGTSLQVLTASGKEDSTLVAWRLGGSWIPASFCYRSSDRTLVVGMERNNKIQVFRFV